jgi:dTDP-4-dehydrorhamnose 3,5-epimerase
MNVIETSLAGVLIIEPKVFGDARGYFMETWNRAAYREAGVDTDFVQDNLSRSARGVLRGLHYQHPRGQGKLVHVLEGEVFDVMVDIRRGSPTFGRWEGVTLSAENKRQVYIPPGFAHGFCVVSETALFAYKCTEFYSPQTEGSVRWDDPALGIAWPLVEPSLSKKDADAMLLKDILPERLPQYGVASCESDAEVLR